MAHYAAMKSIKDLMARLVRRVSGNLMNCGSTAVVVFVAFVVIWYQLW